MNEDGGIYLTTRKRPANKLAGRYLASIKDQRNNDSDQQQQQQQAPNISISKPDVPKPNPSDIGADSVVHGNQGNTDNNVTYEAGFSNPSHSIQRDLNEMNKENTLVNKQQSNYSANLFGRFTPDGRSSSNDVAYLDDGGISRYKASSSQIARELPVQRDLNEMNKENTLVNKQQSNYSANRFGRFTPDGSSDTNVIYSKNSKGSSSNDVAALDDGGVSSRHNASSSQIARESPVWSKPSWSFRARQSPSKMESSVSDNVTSKFRPLKEREERLSKQNIEGKQVLKFVNDKIVMEKATTLHSAPVAAETSIKFFSETSSISTNFRRTPSPSPRHSMQCLTNKNTDNVLGIKKVNYQSDRIVLSPQLVFDSTSTKDKESSSNLPFKPKIKKSLSITTRYTSSRNSTPSRDMVDTKNAQTMLSDINSMVQDVQDQQRGQTENDLFSVCSKLQTAMKELSRVVHSDQREIESKTLSVSKLQNDLEYYKLEQKDSKSMVVSLNDALSNKEVLYHQQIDDLQTNLNESKDKSATLKENLEKIEEQLNSSMKNEQDLNKKVDKLQVAARSKTIVKTPVRSKTYDNQINELQKALDNVSKENLQVKEKLDSYEQRFISTEVNERSLNEKINDFQLDVSDLVEMNDELEHALVNQKNEYESAIDSLRRELRRSEIELHSSKNTLCSTSRDMLALQDSLESSIREQNTLKVESQMQLKAIQNSISKLAMARKSQEEMQQQLNEIREENSALKSSTAQQVTALETCIMERDSIREETSVLKSSTAQQVAALETCIMERDWIIEENSVLKSSTSQQVAALETCIAERDSKLNEMKSSLDFSSQEIHSMKQLIDMSQIQAKQLEIEISGKEDLLSTKNTQLQDINSKLSKSHSKLGRLEKEMETVLASSYEGSSQLENELRSVLLSGNFITDRYDELKRNTSEEMCRRDNSSIEIICHNEEVQCMVSSGASTTMHDQINHQNTALVQAVKCQLSDEMLKNQSGWIACYAEKCFSQLLQEEFRSQMDDDFIRIQSAWNESHVESIFFQLQLGEVRDQMYDYNQGFQEAWTKKSSDLLVAKSEVEDIKKMQAIHDFKEQSAHNGSHVALLNSQLRCSEMQSQLIDTISNLQSICNGNKLELVSQIQDEKLNQAFNASVTPKQFTDFGLQASNDTNILSAWNSCVEFTFSQMHQQTEQNLHLREINGQAKKDFDITQKKFNVFEKNTFDDLYKVQSAWNTNNLESVFSLLQQAETKMQSLDTIQDILSNLKNSNDKLSFVQKQFTDYVKKSSNDFNCCYTELIFTYFQLQDTSNDEKVGTSNHNFVESITHTHHEERGIKINVLPLSQQQPDNVMSQLHKHQILTSRDTITKQLDGKNQTIDALTTELQSTELDLQSLHENYDALVTYNNYLVNIMEMISIRNAGTQMQLASTVHSNLYDPRKNENAQRVCHHKSEKQLNNSSGSNSNLTTFNLHTRAAKVGKIESLLFDMGKHLSLLQDENRNFKLDAVNNDLCRSKLDAALTKVNADFVQIKMFLDDMHSKYESLLEVMQVDKERAEYEKEMMKSSLEMDLQNTLQIESEKVQQMQTYFIESLDEKKFLIAALRQELQVCMCEMQVREEVISSLEDQVGEDHILDQQLTEMRNTILKSESENEELFVQLFQTKIQLRSIQQEYLNLQEGTKEKNDELVQFNQRLRQKNDEIMSTNSDAKMRKLKALVYSSTSALSDSKQNDELKQNEIQKLRSSLDEQHEYILQLELALNDIDEVEHVIFPGEICAPIDNTDIFGLNDIQNEHEVNDEDSKISSNVCGHIKGLEIETRNHNEDYKSRVDNDMPLNAQISFYQALALNLHLLLAEKDYTTSTFISNTEKLENYDFCKAQNSELNASVQDMTSHITVLQSQLTNAEDKICFTGFNENLLREALEENRMLVATHSALQELTRSEISLFDVKIIEGHQSKMQVESQVALIEPRYAKDHASASCDKILTMHEKSNASNTISKYDLEDQNEPCEKLCSVKNEKEVVSLREKKLLERVNTTFEAVVSRLEVQLQHYEVKLKEKNENELVLKSKIHEGHKEQTDMIELLNTTSKELERGRSNLLTTQTSSKVKLKQMQTLLFESSSNIDTQEQQLILKDAEVKELQSRYKESDVCIDEVVSMILKCLGTAESNVTELGKASPSSFKCQSLLKLSNAVVTKLRNLEAELHDEWSLLSNEQSINKLLNRELQEILIHSMGIDEETSSLKVEIETLKAQLSATKAIHERREFQFSAIKLELGACWKELVNKQSSEDCLERRSALLLQNFQQWCFILCEVFHSAYEIESSISDTTKERTDVLSKAATQLEDTVLAQFKSGTAGIFSQIDITTMIDDAIQNIISYLSARSCTLLVLKDDLMKIPLLNNCVNSMDITICQAKINTSELHCKLMDSNNYANGKESEIKILKKKLVGGRKQMNDMVLALNVMTEELNTAGRTTPTRFDFS